MVEVLIAIMLISVGLITLASLQDTGWRSMAKSDYVGRAAGILHDTLEEYYVTIANPNSSVSVGDQEWDELTYKTVTTSGSSTPIRGDMEYTVKATITQTNADPQTFLVTVNVTWSGNSKGISESVEVSRQDIYQF